MRRLTDTLGTGTLGPMPSNALLMALRRDDELCDQAITGLSDWLSDPRRLALRHPLTACMSAILRHLEAEESVLFPRLLVDAPQVRDLIGNLSAEHQGFRRQLDLIEDLVMGEQREAARERLALLREALARHARREDTELFHILGQTITDPHEIRHLFKSGYFRGSFDPLAPSEPNP